MRIQVTADDIAHGEALTCDRCPIARAASRATGLTITVGCDNMTVLNTEHPLFGKRLRLPEAAQEFIRRFDGGYRVEPFAFDVDFQFSAARS